jgi:hypothetical protein
VESGVVIGFSEKWQRFVARDSHGNCAAFELLAPQDVRGGDALKWQRMPLQARMTVTNMRTKEPLHVNALAFDISRDVAIVFLKV